MTKMVRDVMTGAPITLDVEQPVTDAALAMRESEIGDVVVLEKDDVQGIVTDRDIVVRAVALGRDPAKTPLAEVCSRDLTTVDPETTVDEAVRIMRDKAIRRLPVLEGKRVVGVISIGDLAVSQDPKSALADISAAPANA